MSEADCLFCKIVAGEIPCTEIYSTDTVLAFLDIAPVNKGHALVIPKVHQENIFELDSALGADLTRAMKIAGKAIMQTVGADGLNIGMNNHAAAGQLIFHAHFHLIPRFENDGLSLWPQEPVSDFDALAALGQEIRQTIRTIA